MAGVRGCRPRDPPHQGRPDSEIWRTMLLTAPSTSAFTQRDLPCYMPVCMDRLLLTACYLYRGVSRIITRARDLRRRMRPLSPPLPLRSCLKLVRNDRGSTRSNLADLWSSFAQTTGSCDVFGPDSTASRTRRVAFIRRCQVYQVGGLSTDRRATAKVTLDDDSSRNPTTLIAARQRAADLAIELYPDHIARIRGATKTPDRWTAGPGLIWSAILGGPGPRHGQASNPSAARGSQTSTDADRELPLDQNHGATARIGTQLHKQLPLPMPRTNIPDALLRQAVVRAYHTRPVGPSSACRLKRCLTRIMISMRAT